MSEEDIVVVATGNSFIAAEASPHGFYQGSLPASFPGDRSRAVYLGNNAEPPISPFSGVVSPTGESWYQIQVDATLTIISGNIHIALIQTQSGFYLPLNNPSDLADNGPPGDYLIITGTPGTVFVLTFELV